MGEYRVYRNYWNLQNYLNNPFLIFKPDSLDLEDLGTCDDVQSQASYASGPKASNITAVLQAIQSFLDKFRCSKI